MTFTCPAGVVARPTVAILTPAGVPVANGQVGTNGRVTLPIPAAGNYLVNFSGGTCGSTTLGPYPMALSCGSTQSAGRCCESGSVPILLLLCDLSPMPAGCTSARVDCGGTTIWSGSPDASGLVHIPSGPGGLQDCIFYFTAVPPGYSATNPFDPSGGWVIGNLSGSPPAISPYFSAMLCCGGPIPEAMTLTDAFGNRDFTWDGNLQRWHCCYLSPPVGDTLGPAAVPGDFQDPNCSRIGSFPLLISYVGYCAVWGNDIYPGLTVERHWSSSCSTVAQVPSTYAAASGCDINAVTCCRDPNGQHICWDYASGTGPTPGGCSSSMPMAIPMIPPPGHNCMPDPVGGGIVLS